MTVWQHLNLIPDIGQLWLIDLDGTVVVHNAYLNSGDQLLPGVKKLWGEIPEKHVIIILTAREEEYRQKTEEFLKNENLRFNHLLMDLPKGERILINDKKPDGACTAYAINLKRNEGFGSLSFGFDEELRI